MTKDDDDLTNRELSTARNDAYLERYKDGDDPYTALAKEGAPGVQGSLLSCKNGIWTIGEDDKPIKGSPHFLFVLPSMLIGHLKWRDKAIVGNDIGYVRDNFRMKRRFELDDLDQSTWELDDKTGKPKDPWSPRFMALLVELSAPHGDYTFVSGAWGAYFAFKELCSRYRERPTPDAMPVVSLSTHTRPNKKMGGFITGPMFDVVGWADIDAVKSGKKAGTPATKTTSRKAKTEPTMNAAQPAAWGKVKS